MNVLITSAASRLSRELAVRLANEQDLLTLTDSENISTPHKFVRSDLGHAATTNDLVRHIDVIVHSLGDDPVATASERLDYAMRCTYNLLWAAADEGVPRLVFLSSLAVMDRYDEQLVVTEPWRPLPSTDPRTLAHHLCEYVCREFAREGKIDIVTLRLGDISWEGDGPETASSSALYIDDAASAIRGALKADIKAKNLFHVQSAVPRARYATTAAEEALGYKPAARR